MSDIPLQPLVRDQHGVIRFRANVAVRKLLDFATAHGCGLNELACMGIPDEDFEQLAQLIGYSVSGFSELSYVSDETMAKVDDAVQRFEHPEKFDPDAACNLGHDNFRG